jgi:hypothetical protein
VLARSHSTEAVLKLVEIMRSKKTSAVARVRAIGELLDRGYGRPAQQIEAELKHDVPLHSPIEVARRIHFILHAQQQRIPDPGKVIDVEALPAPEATQGSAKQSAQAVPREASSAAGSAPNPRAEPEPRNEPIGDDEEAF